MADPLRNLLAFRLAAAWRRVDRFANRRLAGLGLSHAHIHLLACLLVEGELRTIDLAERTGLEASTVSRLIRELARRRLVQRRANPDDARSRLWSPAKRGRALESDLMALLRRIDERLGRDLPRADHEGLLNALTLMDRIRS